MKGKAFLYLGLLVVMVLIGVEEVYGACSSNPFQCDYVTRGGYDAAVEAWKRVSLLFSSGSQLYILFTIAFIVGLFFLFVSLLLKAGLGLRISFHSWFAFLIGGAILYLSLIIPKGKLVIYDEALNRGPYTVDNIPRVLVLVAGALNEIERRLVGLVGQSSDVVEDYRYNPAGIAFNALGSINAKQVPPYVYQTFFNYNKDCIITTASLENGVTFNDILSGRQSITSIINNSANPALYTVVVNPDGTTTVKRCNEARNDLNNYLGYNNLRRALEAGCSRAGYSPSEVASFNQCRNMVSRALGYLNQNGTLIDVTILQQMLFTEILKDYVSLTGQANIGSYIATARTTGSFIGLGVHANAWIPELKEALQAVVVAISPFVLLFVVTPFAGRALSLVVGFFLWLLVWGVIDAVVHSFGMSMAKSTGRYLATGAMGEGFGVYAAAILPNVTAKIYAIFGALRWSGLALASVMTIMLVRFGGAALTMVASQIASSPQASGAAIGEGMATRPLETVSSMITPGQAMANTAIQMGGLRPFLQGMVASEEAGLFNRMATGIGYRESVSQFGFNQLLGAHAYKQFAQFGGAIGNVETIQNSINRLRSMGFQIGAREEAALVSRFESNPGELMRLGTTLMGAKILADQKPGLFSKEDERILKEGDLLSGLAVADKYMKEGSLQVGMVDGKLGMVVRPSGHSGSEQVFLFDEMSGKVDLVEAKLPQNLRIDSSFVQSVKEEKMAKDSEAIREDLRKLWQASGTSYATQEIRNTLVNTFSKEYNRALENAISKDKELSEALKKNNMTFAEAAGYGYLKLGVKAPVPFLNVGVGGEGKAGVGTKRSREEITQFLEKYGEKIQQAIIEAERQALTRSLDSIKAKGKRFEELESALKEMGATHLTEIAKLHSMSTSSDAKLYHDLTTGFVRYYADKYYEGNTIVADQAISQFLSTKEGETKLKEEMKNFLTDYVKSDRYMAGIEETINKKEEGLNEQKKNFGQDVNQFQNNVDHKINKQNLTPPKKELKAQGLKDKVPEKEVKEKMKKGYKKLTETRDDNPDIASIIEKKVNLGGIVPPKN
ncbi:MAG: conjugal transfer protein TraG N-terminal domain-containing protein [Candidatus Bathyarchaeia archaeon]